MLRTVPQPLDGTPEYRRPLPPRKEKQKALLGLGATPDARFRYRLRVPNLGAKAAQGNRRDPPLVKRTALPAEDVDAI